MTNHGIVTTSDKPWKALSSLEKGARLRSLEAKRLMLGGETFTNAARWELIEKLSKSILGDIYKSNDD